MSNAEKRKERVYEKAQTTLGSVYMSGDVSQSFNRYSETKAATEEPTQSAEQETVETREITDMAGRKVTVPAVENIESVFQQVR